MASELDRTEVTGNRYRVIDNFLPFADWTDSLERYRTILMKPALSSIDPKFDGFAYRGGSNKRRLLGDQPDTLSKLIASSVTQTLEHFNVDDLTGAEITATAWSYPAGSRLSWHNDAGSGRIAAYVYFIHEDWRLGWGGDLGIIDEVIPSDKTATSNLLSSTQLVTAIFPRPNRLVVFLSNTMHGITRVDPCAGDRVRNTMTGFISRSTA